MGHHDERAPAEELVERLNALTHGAGYSLDDFVLLEGRMDVVLARPPEDTGKASMSFLGEIGLYAFSRVSGGVYGVELGVPLGIRNQLPQYQSTGGNSHLRLYLSEPWAVENRVATGRLVGMPEMHAKVIGSFVVSQ